MFAQTFAVGIGRDPPTSKTQLYCCVRTAGAGICELPAQPFKDDFSQLGLVKQLEAFGELLIAAIEGTKDYATRVEKALALDNPQQVVFASIGDDIQRRRYPAPSEGRSATRLDIFPLWSARPSRKSGPSSLPSRGSRRPLAQTRPPNNLPCRFSSAPSVPILTSALSVSHQRFYQPRDGEFLCLDVHVQTQFAQRG